MRWRGWAALVLLLSVLISGCAKPGAEPGTQDGERLQVVTTTGMIADLVKNIGGDRVEVVALMGPGVDPHLYKASEGDIGRLSRAQVIFYNGLHLEGRMGDVLVQMARTTPTVAVAERIPASLLLITEDGVEDPHIWFDVSLWMQAADVVRDTLVEIDPAHAEAYRANATAYQAELEALHAYAEEQIAAVPAEQRVLVTAHDAFAYFGRAYGIEVRGLQGISTAAEYGLADLQALVDLLTERQIKAVFVESSVPRRSVEALVEGAAARGHQVSIGGELYSDAMGAEGTPAGTYIGMVRHNVDTIVGALK